MSAPRMKECLSLGVPPEAPPVAAPPLSTPPRDASPLAPAAPPLAHGGSGQASKPAAPADASVTAPPFASPPLLIAPPLGFSALPPEPPPARASLEPPVFANWQGSAGSSRRG